MSALPSVALPGSEQTNPNKNTPKKPCRACTDFKTWTKMQGLSCKDPKKEKKENEEPRRPDCPLDRNELGRSTWSMLHTIAAYYPDIPTRKKQRELLQFMNIFPTLYPCNDCAQDFKEEIKKNPIDVRSNHDFSQWLCRMHNQVNAKLGKPTFDCRKVNERWQDGWKDGSCD